MPLADFQTMVDDMVRDVDARIATAERDRAIDSAVRRYGADRPRVLVRDVTAAAAGHYLDLPADWESDFSDIQSIENPLGEVPPALLSGDAFDLYEDPTEIRILLAAAASAGETFRISFTAPHTLDGATDTIPAKHREAVSSLAAADLLSALAGIHAASTDEAIHGAPHVDMGDKSAKYARRAEKLRDRYFEILGIKRNQAKAGSAIVDWDATDSRGRDRLLHRSRYR